MRSFSSISLVSTLLLMGCDTTALTEPQPPATRLELTGCWPDYNSLPEALRQAGPADPERVIVVYKRQKLTALYEHEQLTQCVTSDFGDWPYEAKTQSDGESTPEGWYTVALKRTSNPDDEYPKTFFTEALHVSYPNLSDISRAEQRGVVDSVTASQLRDSINQGQLPNQETAMGGAILVHSWENGLTTAGCVGLDAEDMHVLFTKTENGDPILILPWQTIMFEDGTSAQDVIPPRPEPEPFPVEMIDQEKSSPGHTVMKPIEITAD